MARPMYCFLYILGRIVMVYNPFLTIPYQSVIKASSRNGVVRPLRKAMTAMPPSVCAEA